MAGAEMFAAPAAPQARAPHAVGDVSPAADMRRDARWADAIRATVGLWLFALLIYSPVIVQRHQAEGLVSIALDSSTIFVSLLFAGPIFLMFRQTLGQPLASRAVAIGLVVIAVAIAQAAFDLLFTAWVANHLEAGWHTMARDLTRGYGATVNYVSVFAVNFALFQLAYARRRDRRQERRLADMRSAEQTAELEALRFKLNPHFLFNTLNGISAMIVTKRLTEADEMVERLSAFLRASLNGNPLAPVTIEHELGVIEHYTRIEEVRFGDRLEVELGCAGDACDRQLPPLLVQGLVEHAVEAASRADVQARVSVTAAVEGANLCITIEHPHMEMPERHLAAARARIAGLAGAQVTREPGVTRLCLPADRSEDDAA